ncbi:PAAR motif family protein, partial [Yersinia pestis PY-12]
MAPLLVPP